jgi:hypothetical protein
MDTGITLHCSKITCPFREIGDEEIRFESPISASLISSRRTNYDG